MDVCLAEATSHYVHYLDTLQYAEVSNGNFTVEALPLIKPPRQSKKSFKEFFHIVPNISTEDQEVIRAVMSEDPLCISRLPNSVRPRDALGTSCHLQLVLHQHPDGSCTALKFFHSKVSIPMGLARTLCEDQVLVIDYSLAKNSDAVKKAFLYMLSQISGHHWMTQVLRQKQIPKEQRLPGDSEKAWNPTEEELRSGINYINDYAPLANSKNEQYLWVLLQIRDATSPLHGWPQHVVLKACANRVTGNSQAEPEYFFPLLLLDLNPTFLNKIVPMILPLMPSFGLMVLGKAGVGKTPTAQIMAMAVARHLTSSRSLSGLPGWRRSKQIDGFRERPGEVNVPALLDDPNLSSINLEDLKSFLDVGENCLVDARYRAAKFSRNQCRIVLNNEWDESKEPDTFLSHITWEQFKEMFLTACQYPKFPHLMAILKRTMVIIAGHNGVYIRLPSEHTSEPIHCFNEGGVTEDWLQETHKKFYGMYKQGVHEKYFGYDSAVEEEQALVAKLLATPEEKDYIHRAETHDRWRLEAAPASPPASTAALRTADASPIHLKEEITSPVTKKPRACFGLIDVDAEAEELELGEFDDVFGHGDME